MTLADDFLDMLPDFAEFAATAVHVATPGTVTNAGVLTETATRTTISVFGPVNEIRTSEAAGASCAFYIGADQDVTPRIGHRIEHDSRQWLVNTVERMSVNGTSIMFALGCAECGAEVA